MEISEPYSLTLERIIMRQCESSLFSAFLNSFISFSLVYYDIQLFWTQILLLTNMIRLDRLLLVINSAKWICFCSPNFRVSILLDSSQCWLALVFRKLRKRYIKVEIAADIQLAFSFFLLFINFMFFWLNPLLNMNQP